jgi:23S rRNA pseudouridine1911/1915/1917 synthase
LKWTSRVIEGKEAVSHFKVLEVFGDKGLAALVECRLETGRTHQIRVHMAEQCKTPLLADSLYGHQLHDPRLIAVAEGIGRQALHAESLAFTHPVSGEALSFSSEVPQDFARALVMLRNLTP